MTARKRQVNRIRGSVLAASWLVVCASARAQWTAIRLHGPGDYSSGCLAVGVSLQGGWRELSATQTSHRPAIWSGSPASEIDLSPTPTDTGEVNAIWGSFQAGNLTSHASLWQGSVQSRIDLHPSGVLGSDIRAMRGTQQAGYVITPSTASHAAMWNGTAASFVDLNPAGANYSYAYATDGTQQGGIADFTIAGQFYQHAALWSGSAASFVDLNPPSPVAESLIKAMAPGQQVGWFYTSETGDQHAALWSGTASSLVDLHPFPGFGGSILNATTGAIQVGSSHVPGGGSFGHAGIWFGTAASFIDLHQFLPPGYGASGATSVYESNGVIYVGGVASNPLAGTSEAFMWISVPAPSPSALVFAGMLLRRRPGRRVHRTPE